VRISLIAMIALLPGGVIVLVTAWLRRRWLARDRRAIEAHIVPPVQRFSKATDDELNAIRAAAERRRHAADDKRRDAARITSGQSVDERLRMVRGRH
jgi:hypothetical protein